MEATAAVPQLEAITSLDEERARQLQVALKRHSGAKMLVILSGFPDPDGISSALAHRYLANEHGIETTILTFRDPSHQENRALLKTLDIELTLYHEDLDLSEFSCFSLVDSQKINTPIDDELKGKAFVAFVDHHKRTSDVPAEFVDIREDVGATASIYASYLRQRFPKGLDRKDEMQVQIATALAHGIRTDTQNLIEATRFDLSAVMFLDSAVSKDLLRKISRQALSPEIMELIRRALENKQIYDNYMLSDVGFVRSEDRDGIPQAADFLLRRGGTDTVLVFGIVDGKNIDGSLRTSSEVVDPDSFLKKTFGMDEATGRYYGGGNLKDKGGFQIPLGYLATHPDRELTCRLARELVSKRFREAIGKASEG